MTNRDFKEADRFKPSVPGKYLPGREKVEPVRQASVAEVVSSELVPITRTETIWRSGKNRPEEVPLDDISQLEVDPAVVFKLAVFQVTEDEAAGFLDLPDWVVAGKLDRRGELFDPEFHSAWYRGRQVSAVSLRRKQFMNAMGGNTAMQIHLGKHLLGQSDKPAPKDDDDARELTLAEKEQMSTDLMDLARQIGRRKEDDQKLLDDTEK